jgi:hypothetical protein
MRQFFFVLLVLILSGTTAYSEHHEPLELFQFPSLIANIRITEPLDFCGEPVELDKHDALERMEKELLLTLWDRPQVVLWIKRSTRYFPLIEEVL